MTKPSLRARSIAAATLVGALLFGGGIPGALPAKAQVNVAAFTVSGTVTGGHGRVLVVLYQWPAQATTAALKPGQKVPLKAMASQRTSSGSYTFSVAPATLGVAKGTVVNMEVVASANGAMDTYSFPRQLVNGPEGQPVLAVLSSKPKMASQTANLHLARARPQCPKGGAPLSLHFKKNIGDKSAVVGALFSRIQDIKAEFTYKQGQSSSLGVGISGGVQYANFSAEGTHAVSSTAGVTFRNYHGHTAHNYRTEFRYGKYRWLCDNMFTDSWGAWQVQANEYAGGASTVALHQSPNARHCAYYQPGSTFFRNSSSAWTFKAGVSISDSIGIDLSAQTGYDRDASIAYVVGNRGRLICGFKGQPAGNSPPPRLVVAGES